jgi:hypothetical protein
VHEDKKVLQLLFSTKKKDLFNDLKEIIVSLSAHTTLVQNAGSNIEATIPYHNKDLTSDYYCPSADQESYYYHFYHTYVVNDNVSSDTEYETIRRYLIRGVSTKAINAAVDCCQSIVSYQEHIVMMLHYYVDCCQSIVSYQEHIVMILHYYVVENEKAYSDDSIAAAIHYKEESYLDDVLEDVIKEGSVNQLHAAENINHFVCGDDYVDDQHRVMLNNVIHDVMIAEDAGCVKTYYVYRFSVDEVGQIGGATNFFDGEGIRGAYPGPTRF